MSDIRNFHFFNEFWLRLDSIIGEGTFGQVFKGECVETQATVALKKVRLDREREGFPITAIREIKLLKKLSHENIVRLDCVVQAKDLSSFFLVFEYVDNDLTGIIENRLLKAVQIKVLVVFKNFEHYQHLRPSSTKFYSDCAIATR